MSAVIKIDTTSNAAQFMWKLCYRRWRVDPLSMTNTTGMRQYRREAALERALAAETRRREAAEAELRAWVKALDEAALINRALYWNARAERDAAQDKAAQYQTDWVRAKYEFGVAMSEARARIADLEAARSELEDKLQAYRNAAIRETAGTT